MPQSPHPVRRPSPRPFTLLALTGPLTIAATQGPELWTNPWTWWGVATGGALGAALVLPGRRAARRDR